jgi:type IV secretion system protein VirB8
MTSPASDPNSANLGLPPNGVAARAHYYEAASSWSDDTHATLRASRKTAWIIAGVAIGVAALQAFALATLLPLKQSVPYTITVDRETGYVQTTRGVNLGNLSETDAMAQSFAVQYVLAREGFEATDYRENYRKIMMWSQGGAEAEYARDWDKNNPSGVAQRYRPTTRVKVTVKSVTLLGPRSAMVRFDTEQSEGPSSGGIRQPFVATIGYSFSGKPISDQDRYFNPLGYQVATYRRDAETAQPISVAAPPPMPVQVPAAVVPTPASASASAPLPNGQIAPAPSVVAVPSATSSPGFTPNASPASKTGNPNGEEFPNQ